MKEDADRRELRRLLELYKMEKERNNARVIAQLMGVLLLVVLVFSGVLDWVVWVVLGVWVVVLLANPWLLEVNQW